MKANVEFEHEKVINIEILFPSRTQNMIENITSRCLFSFHRPILLQGLTTTKVARRLFKSISSAMTKLLINQSVFG